MDLIDRNYLIQHKRKVKFFGLGPDDESWGYAVQVEVIKKAPALIQQNKWISVEKELPREKRMCLIYTPCDGFMCVGFYDGHDNWQNKDRWMIITALRSTRTLTKKVSHWMPLPEPPDWHLPEEENVE